MRIHFTNMDNDNSRDIGLVISVYQQGSQWIADVTNNLIDHWIEHRLHYSIVSRKDVIEWAIDFADGRNFELLWEQQKRR